MQNNKKLYWILGSVGGIAILLAIFSKLGWLGNKNTTLVATEKVSRHDIIETVSASGKIYPVSEVKISPDVSGEIIEMTLQEGDSVRKGQLLAAINSVLYKSMVSRADAQLNQSRSAVSNAGALMQQAKAQFEQATLTYERNKKLYNDRIISAAEFETAEAGYKTAQATFKAAMESIKGNQYGVQSARANADEARQNLQRTTLYAPMSGIVSKLFVKKGERVVGTAQMAGTEIMRIADMSRMKVDVEVGENDIQKVKYGDTAIVEVDAYPNKTFKGQVVLISQSSTATGTANALSSLTDQVTNYTVSVEILPESYRDIMNDFKGHFPFRPGMSATVDIITHRENNILSVPINAVTTREDDDSTKASPDNRLKKEIKEYVFVVDTKTNKTALRRVTTGLQDNQYIQIINGLTINEQVVVAPFSAIARTLKKDMSVKVVPKEELYSKEKDEEEE